MKATNAPAGAGCAELESSFGSLLRRYRLAAGLSQAALAERAQMSANGIGALERGYRQTPQRETLSLLAEALELDAEQLRLFAPMANRRDTRRPGGAAVPGDFFAPGAPSASRLVGRETELADLLALVRKGQLVTVTGAGGIGKTATAGEVVNLIVAGEAATLVIELATLRDAASIVAEIARALGVEPRPNVALLDAVIAHLKTQPRLLLLDNCEHVIADLASVVSALLRGSPQLRILATSREPLRVAAEVTYRLPSLGVPSAAGAQRISATQAQEYDAIRLFVERSRALDDRFRLTDANAEIVADICRRLDGIPLAIELAAERTKIYSLPQLRDRLDERFRLLVGGRRDVLPRQQSLRALIGWSYDLLEAKERSLLGQLSVFTNGFTLEDAATIGRGDGEFDTDVFDRLQLLVDKSLVESESDAAGLRFRMLESTGAYAREKLALLAPVPLA